jgi:hypothetical protein
MVVGVKFQELRALLDPELRLRFRKKNELTAFLREQDGRARVGGPKGKGRLTAKKALDLLEG